MGRHHENLNAARAEFDRLVGEYPQLAAFHFRVDSRSTRRLGACYFRGAISMNLPNGPARVPAGEILISRWLLEGDTKGEQLVETVRHEVAHALAGPYEGHGATWRYWARKVGARPARIASHADMEGVLHEHNGWTWTCSRCGKVVRYARKPRNWKTMCRHYSEPCARKIILPDGTPKYDCAVAYWTPCVFTLTTRDPRNAVLAQGSPEAEGGKV